MVSLCKQTRYIINESGASFLEKGIALPCDRPIQHALQEYINEQGRQHNCRICQEIQPLMLTFTPGKNEIKEITEELCWVFQFRLHAKDKATPNHSGWYCVQEITPKVVHHTASGKILHIVKGEGWIDDPTLYEQNKW